MDLYSMSSELCKLILQSEMISEDNLKIIFTKYGDAVNPFLLEELEKIGRTEKFQTDHLGKILFVLKTSYEYDDHFDKKLIWELVPLFHKIIDQNKDLLGKDEPLDHVILFIADFLFHFPRLLTNASEGIQQSFVKAMYKLYDIRYKEENTDDFYLAIHNFMSVLRCLKTTYGDECLRKYLNHHDSRIQEEARENLELNS